MQESFAMQLEKYAQVIVHVGLNLRAGQRLLIRAGGGVDGVSLEAYPLVRKLTEVAYQAGASYVAVLWDDEELQRIRLLNAPLDSMEEFAFWKTDVAEQYIDNGDAILTIHSRDPQLLEGLDPDKVQQRQRVEVTAAKGMSDRISDNATNWLVVSASVSSWAKRIFPDIGEEEAVARLWSRIFAACRIDQADPVAVWREHVANLGKRTEYLNAKRYTALRYRAPGTDLTVGLADGHIWVGGALTSRNDITFVPNMPTEEVFTMPHKHRVEGVVQSSTPLSYGGSLIDDFSLRFVDGRVVSAEASVGQQALDSLLATDEGSRYLGEVALVPHSSPISQSGVLFLNTLYDENASSHLALGQAYRTTVQDGVDMSDSEYDQVGGNLSLSHVDFMVGSAAMDIDGVQADGSVEPVMRQGEWAFSV